MQRQKHLTGIQEKVPSGSSDFWNASNKDILVYRDDANKERDMHNSRETMKEEDILFGVDVYGLESCRDDILFEDPNSPECILDDSISDADMKSWYYSDSSREEMQWQKHLTGIQEKVLGCSGDFWNARDKDVLIYREEANKERDINTLSKNPMEWEYQVKCRQYRSVSNDQSTERDKGNEGTESERQRDWWYSCLCVIVSLVVLCRYVLLLLQLLHDSAFSLL